MSDPSNGRHLVVYTDAPLVAGAEQALATLVEFLPEWVQVTVVGSNREAIGLAAERRPGTAVVLAPPLSTKSDITNLLAVRRILSDLAPSAIHLNKTEVAGLRYVECLTRAIGSARVVSVVHHVEQPATKASRLLTRRLAARADAIVAVSEHLARQLETILGLDRGRVHTIENALPALSMLRRPAGDRFVVGTMARFVPHKAVDDLIAAVAATENIHLIIGGDGPERERLKRSVWRLGIATRVEFLGWVEPEMVLTNCHIVASAARIEGHPLTLLDARRRGLPIVATAVGGVAEIVDDGVNGMLVPPGHVTGLANAISTLSQDGALRERMSRAAIAAAAGADDPAKMAAAYCDLYWPTIAEQPDTPGADVIDGPEDDGERRPGSLPGDDATCLA